ncbi:MAG: ribonuclease P protein component [Candidatus Sungbacteria bacterium]|uniref:Ribonuclease P protein component n=1 Tax=Candidatus Sungiibacteriota bacterium TaxID=2750080 RepID=A0A931SCZ6_9BACT|nr:ribonuclease P protein component [Candidatus Sungbacteria bacterium]
MALRRAERLRKKGDIRNAFRRSFRYESALFVVHVHKKRNLPGRVTVIISKKVSKKATERNRLRRFISEWLRTSFRVGTRSIDCVLTLKPGASMSPKRILLAELLKFGSAIH